MCGVAWRLVRQHRILLRREPLALTVGATTRQDERLWIAPGVASNYGRCAAQSQGLGFVGFMPSES